MEIKPIRSEKDYDAMVAEIERLMADDARAASDRLEVLATLVTTWQREHRPIAQARPVDAIRAAMDDRGFSRKDLARAIGSESKVSEVLSGRRGLSTTMIAALHREFEIPLRSLIDMDLQPKPRGVARKKTSRRTGSKRHPPVRATMQRRGKLGSRSNK